MVAFYFTAHAVVTGVLVLALSLHVWQYRLIPPLFAAAALITVWPPVARCVNRGPLAWRLLPPLFYAGIISLASAVRPHAALPGASYVFHPVEYAGLAWILLHALHGGLVPPLASSTARRLTLVTLAVCFTFAGIDELHQAHVPGRVCSLLDVGLDSAGMLAGAALFAAMARWRAARGQSPG